MVDYLLLEHKGLDMDSLVAIPRGLDTPDLNLDRAFYRAGNLEGLNPDDFQPNHWHSLYVPIEFTRGLSPETRGIDDLTRADLDTFLSKHPELDPSTFMKDRRLSTMLSDHRVIDAELYYLRVRGNSQVQQKVLRSTTVYFAPLGQTASFDGANIKIGDENLALSPDQSYLLHGGDMSESSAEFLRVGRMKVHSKSLRPYVTRGTYGSPHQNGPWIIFRDKLDKHTIGFVSPED